LNDKPNDHRRVWDKLPEQTENCQESLKGVSADIVRAGSVGSAAPRG
jgi:hypothetical protein